VETITVETTVNAPVEKAWAYFTNPEHITQWNFADDSWHCPRATNDLRAGGKFSSRMEAKDSSEGFDFEGTYDEVVPQQRIAYHMSDGRTVTTTFAQEGSGTKIITVFDPESENPLEMQRSGWQAILENYKKHVEQTT
jgi:uncharacterized protein YndB with AHSA1/START domain